MTNPISSNVNQINLFRANSAFKKATEKPKETSAQEIAEEHNAPKEAEKMFTNHNIDEIREIAKDIGNDSLSNEDLKYGFYFGRSVIVDYSV